MALFDVSVYGARTFLRRPFIGLAICLLIGVALGFVIPRNLPLLFFVMGSSLVLYLIFHAYRPAILFLFLAVIIQGWVLAVFVNRNPSPCVLSSLMQRECEYVDIVGVIDDDPVLLKGWQKDKERWRFPVRVQGIRRITAWQKATGIVKVDLWVPKGLVPFAYGDRWLIEGALRQQQKQGWAHYLTYHMKGSIESCTRLSENAGWVIKAHCLKTRAACAAILSEGIGEYPQYVGLLHALMLGYRRALPTELREAFSCTGTLHIFAISGLHVGMVALLLASVLKTTGLSRIWWIWILAPALILYVLATGMKASAIRAGIMAIAYWSAFMVNRKPDGATALALAATIILILDPAQLITPGFILSFSVVAGILVYYPVVVRCVPLPEPDPWRLQMEAKWILIARNVTRYLIGLVAISISAWIISAPLTAYYFNLFSPIALAGNILIVPGAFLVVLTGCISLLTGCISTVCAEIFNHANAVFIQILLWIVDWAGRVPGGHFYVRSPEWFWMVLWYLMPAILLLRPRSFRYVFPAMVLGGMLFCVWNQYIDANLFVDIIDVGQGNAIFVNTPGHDDILIDAGPEYQSYRVVRHLHKQGVNHLKVLVLTHPDSGHVGGAMAILQQFDVGELWVSPHTGRSHAYRQLLEFAHKKGIHIRRMTHGKTGEWAGNLQWEILHPDGTKKYRRANDASLVLRVAREGCAVLIMGGAGWTAEKQILSQPIDPCAPIMIAGDHASFRTCSDWWLETVGARDIIVSVGPFSRSGAPAPVVLARMKKYESKIWRTDQDGSMRIRWLHPTPKACPQDHYQIIPIDNL